MEAPPGFEPGIEVLQGCTRRLFELAVFLTCWWAAREPITLGLLGKNDGSSGENDLGQLGIPDAGHPSYDRRPLGDRAVLAAAERGELDRLVAVAHPGGRRQLDPRQAAQSSKTVPLRDISEGPLRERVAEQERAALVLQRGARIDQKSARTDLHVGATLRGERKR